MRVGGAALRRGVVAFFVGAGLAAGTAACGGSTPPLSASGIMQYDAAAHTVQLTADAAYGGLGGDMNFDGYSNGHLTVTVPYGWVVQVR